MSPPVTRAAGGPAPGALGLGPGEVHVWHGTLDLSHAALGGLGGLLAADERARAARFRFPRDRDRYVAGRGQLRVLLSRYTGVDPRAIAFRYGEYEKPALAGPGPCFNVSHSGPVLLIAVTAIGEVGVDVELDDPDFAGQRIAERFFSPAEVAQLASLAPELRARGFLTCWTRKEAFIKARGDGLQLALDSFDVSLLPGQPGALLRTAWSRDEPKDWCLYDLSDTRAGYIAAVAVRSATEVTVRTLALPGADQMTFIQEER